MKKPPPTARRRGLLHGSEHGRRASVVAPPPRRRQAPGALALRAYHRSRVGRLVRVVDDVLTGATRAQVGEQVRCRSEISDAQLSGLSVRPRRAISASRVWTSGWLKSAQCRLICRVPRFAWSVRSALRTAFA